jgi:tetratricopeptide (TPR) repeat protein
MVEQRQRAERQRQLGNEAFKAGQYSEALRCYEQGLEAQRHDMTLHANAAMAALKLKCYVAAQEHCDKVCWVGSGNSENTAQCQRHLTFSK